MFGEFGSMPTPSSEPFFYVIHSFRRWPKSRSRQFRGTAAIGPQNGYPELSGLRSGRPRVVVGDALRSSLGGSRFALQFAPVKLDQRKRGSRWSGRGVFDAPICEGSRAWGARSPSHPSRRGRDHRRERWRLTAGQGRGGAPPATRTAGGAAQSQRADWGDGTPLRSPRGESGVGSVAGQPGTLACRMQRPW
jgi:hypothetical protein